MDTGSDGCVKHLPCGNVRNEEATDVLVPMDDFVAMEEPRLSTEPPPPPSNSPPPLTPSPCARLEASEAFSMTEDKCPGLWDKLLDELFILPEKRCSGK